MTIFINIIEYNFKFAVIGPKNIMETLIPVLLFAVSSSLTPGPNNFMLMNSGLNFGVKRSLPHYFGICFGFPIMVLIVAVGFGAIFEQYSWLKHFLKVFGAGYLLYLAIQIIIASNKPNKSKTAKPFSFLQATLFQWINPKAWLMAIGAISIYSLTTNYFSNALLISLIFCITCLICVGAWLFFGAILDKVLTKDNHRKWFNISMALCLIASIAMIFID